MHLIERKFASVFSKVSLGSEEFPARLEIRCFRGGFGTSSQYFGGKTVKFASVGSDVGGKGSLIGIEEVQNSLGRRRVSIEGLILWRWG